MPEFQRLRAASSLPSPDDVLHDLVAFHTAHPGITEATLGAMRTADGRSGYDVLVDRMPDDARAMLDLGCGNGPLLASALARRPSLTALCGVDACEADLGVARERLRDPRVDLRCERAQALSLPDGAVDVVLSHHAFYLFEPIEPAVAEVARVLRPGGVFAFATTSPTEARCPLFVELVAAMSTIVLGEKLPKRGWGDPRVWSLEGLRSLLVAPGYFAEPIAIYEHTLHAREAPDALADRLLRFFYSAWLPKPEGREALREAWRTMLSRDLDDEGLARFDFPFAEVVVTRR